MTDEQKLELVKNIVASMAPEFRQFVINELAAMQTHGEVQLNVSSNDQGVRLDFGRALAWFFIPKAHALQLGALIMQHAGATLERRERIPGPPGNDGPPPAIDV